MITWYPIGYCTKCDTKDSLVLQIGHDHSIKATKYDPDSKIKITSHMMHCTNCGSDFFIDWRGGYPKPLRSPISINRILKHYKQNI